ncbi:KH domain-containing protein [Helicobacter sp. 11S02596-1]|uniref:KH domain-containing protein n=1 Tax=Helicobacter sp. 11S02596-1 TaxID=1476194 RepID=UPI000BA5AF98|nr:KH domain-containing protein [Helicobacter sp. 11S02596-1]PAF43156.1 RNA-binding protein [Helicobacter sp. 11S02596-1]
MVDQFLADYVKKIVQRPDDVRISLNVSEDGCKDIVIHTSIIDIGRVIGKDGKMIGAIKTFISGAKAKDGFTYRVVVQANENTQ